MQGYLTGTALSRSYPIKRKLTKKIWFPLKREETVAILRTKLVTKWAEQFKTPYDDCIYLP